MQSVGFFLKFCLQFSGFRKVDVNILSVFDGRAEYVRNYHQYFELDVRTKEDKEMSSMKPFQK